MNLPNYTYCLDMVVILNGKSCATDETRDLSEEQLKDVLDQLTDHTVPDREKCPLVQRLNAENAFKEEKSEKLLTRFIQRSTASSSAPNPSRNHRKHRLQRSSSKDAEKSNGAAAVGKAVHSSQSLQDLMSASSFHTESDFKPSLMRSIGANHNRSGAGKLVQSRHNSITSQFYNNNNNSNNNSNKEDMSEVSSVADTRTNSQTPIPNSLKGARNKSLNKGHTSQQMTTTSSTGATAVTAEAAGDESGVCEPPTNSSRTFHECFATQSVVNHNMDSCDKNCTPLCNRCAPVCEQQPQYIEMRDLRQKAQIVEYTSDSTGYNSPVDTFMNLGLKAVNTRDDIKTGVAERVVNHNHSCDYEAKDGMNCCASDESSKLNQFQDAVKPYDSLTNQDSDLSQANHNNNSNQTYSSITSKDPTNRNSINFKKKKTKELPTKLAEEIEGYIGYIEDVDALEALINSSGNETVKSSVSEVNANTNVKDNTKKKSLQMMANSVSKRKNGSTNVTANQSQNNKSSVLPNIPLSTSSSSFSSDEANGVNKHSFFAQRTDSLTHGTTSPLNSSTESKGKTALNSNDLEDEEVEEEKLSMTTLNSSSFMMGSGISADLLCTASDSEMADREKGFVTPKSKHFKRRKGLQRRIDNQMMNKSQSMQSSTSTTPSSSTVSGVGQRGYESEREYQYMDDYRRRQNSSSVCSRRKSLSSVPHSEHNSAYNSDGELSSHSMPIRNESLNTETGNSDTRTTASSISSTPKASYADIAKTPNFGLSSIGIHKRSSMDAMFATNSVNSPLSVQYQDFPQLDLPLPPVVDVSTPSSPNNSKMIEALVSPPQPKSTAERRTSDSCSAPTSMTNTPVPHIEPQNECLFSETVKNTDNEVTTIEQTDGSTVPAVIMCDYSESVPLSDIGSVTFGFFDDYLGANSEQNSTEPQTPQNPQNDTLLNETPNASEIKAKSPIKTSPEATGRAISPKLSRVELMYIDVDKKSFNYEHIIGFIKKAWDNAKSDYKYRSYETSQIVK
ncbi:unnamed protein product [Medioppia subpectinata]|uniref:Uncharacterized protein n=1 Tax=Medioppia subpectinata TaxID=1979941 RepID=A0A7R9KDE8_9ACAR|nr:unnamed protein product [Medioppia subpectinata]CAG2101203.1 unnamed protein product [Medioppia subpectinata]